MPKSLKPRGAGAKDAIGRYSTLKRQLDNDLLNRNWTEINTTGMDRQQTPFNFVDIFSGAGGLSLGFRQAGLNKILSVEIDRDASSTIRRNFPESFHYEGMIEHFSNKRVKRIVGKRRVHIVCGGPPCQGFSVAGLRNPHDPRNQLFRELMRVVESLNPWYIVMENVPGILTMQGGRVYREILRQFESLGYSGTSVRILEAATFGVPQLRTRAFFIGNRIGNPNPYPKEQLAKSDYLSIESAIDDLKDLPPNRSINHEWTKHSRAMEERISRVPPGGSLYETFRDAWKRQYRGVPSMTAKENHGGVHIHYEKNRVISARELARLQTFPDDFIFSGTMKRAYWQIGNAIPCLLAKNIGLAIVSQLEKESG